MDPVILSEPEDDSEPEVVEEPVAESEGVPRKRVEVYKAKDGWRWKAKAGNSRTVGASEEGLTRKASAIAKAQKQFPDRPVYVENQFDGYLYPLDDDV